MEYDILFFICMLVLILIFLTKDITSKAIIIGMIYLIFKSQKKETNNITYIKQPDIELRTPVSNVKCPVRDVDDKALYQSLHVGSAPERAIKGYLKRDDMARYFTEDQLYNENLEWWNDRKDVDMYRKKYV
jgi:hypothetical protein